VLDDPGDGDGDDDTDGEGDVAVPAKTFDVTDGKMCQSLCTDNTTAALKTTDPA
jgi:hypothetical protein